MFTVILPKYSSKIVIWCKRLKLFWYFSSILMTHKEIPSGFFYHTSFIPWFLPQTVLSMPVCATFCHVLCLVIVPGLSLRPVQPAASPACWHKLTEELPVTLAPPIALTIPAMFLMETLWSHINLRWQLCSVSHLTPYRYFALLIRMLIPIISSNFLYDYNSNTLYTSFLQKSTY